MPATSTVAGQTYAPNSIGATQFNDFYWQKKALIEITKEQYFGQMADTFSMPKHFGKTIKKYHYLPLLDDRNINDQGIDANGAAWTNSVTIEIQGPDALAMYFEAEDSSANDATAAAAALDAARLKAIAWAESDVSVGGLGLTLVGGDNGLKVANITTQNALYTVTENTAVNSTGNLYGSSKDVGTISGKLPALSETGGRVNRVGFKRVELQGTLQKFGFFDEYTKESLDFDSDAELFMHINREMLRGANEMTEDALQIDLLNAAGILRFGGDATATSELTGENGATHSVPTYEDFMRLNIDLNDNNTPKGTKMVTGSRMIDTVTVEGARYMYCGSEMEITLRTMKDADGNKVFIGTEKYAAAGSVARGEIGQIGNFKIIIVPEMMHWEGAGASVSANDGYRETSGKYDVFPLLVVGSESFTTVGFQTDGKSVKFKIKHVAPETTTAYSKSDPYGEMGFMSIKWYYGFMILRAERIALIKSVAKW